MQQGAMNLFNVYRGILQYVMAFAVIQMKKTIQESFKQLISSRQVFAAWLVLTLLTIGAVLFIALSIRPSEVQLVTHYSAFGVTHLYRDQWYYLLSFAVFAVVVAILHTAIALKLLKLHYSRMPAIYTIWLGVAVVILCWITSSVVINVWSSI
jgi:hypothetical protein